MASDNLLIKFINLILYGNFWIALAALAMGLQTQYILTGKLVFSPLMIFIFTSTLLLYALHRIVGLKKVSAFQDQGRYLVISTFKSHILFYAIVSGIASVYLFFQLAFPLQLSLFFPALISLAYVLPVLGKKRRLRDFDHIKIYLIFISWAWVTVILPAQELAMLNVPVLFIFLERAFFVFAITLPFDIRDLQIDAHTEVRTIPSRIGVKNSIWLALFSLLICWIFIYLNFRTDVYAPSHFLALSIAVLVTAILVYFSDRIKHDYYFTGLLDGTMLLQFGLVYFFSL